MSCSTPSCGSRCAADLERKVEAIRASTCEDVSKKAESLWRKMKASCDKQQASFDAGNSARSSLHSPSCSA